jgi:predicted ATPase
MRMKTESYEFCLSLAQLLESKMAVEEPKSPILISEIHLQNLLSFGPDAAPIPLGPLNVLIGANGSGKSNLIEAISLLKAMPTDLGGFINDHGGMDAWIWKIQPEHASYQYPTHAPPKGLGRLRIKLVSKNGTPYYHSMEMRASAAAIQIVHEHFGDGRNHLFDRSAAREDNGTQSLIAHEGELKKITPVRPDQSILAQAKDPKAFPELAEIAKNYASISVFGRFQFGRDSDARTISPMHRDGTILKEDFSNLNAFLLRLFESSATKKEVLNALQSLFDGIQDIEIQKIGDFSQLRIKEGTNWFPANRLSDGTLRYICLLAILLDPTPPPLICIEEPELGMHPDLIVKIADLLIEASSRTQLIVTTHSDIILDVLSSQPESVLVCEKHDGKTQITRLDEESIKPFLEHRSLGDMWNSNIIGGRRW